MKAVTLAAALACALVCCCYVRPSAGASILAVFPLGGASHWEVFRGLLEQLAGRGHQLTVVTPFQREGDPWTLVRTTVHFGGGSAAGSASGFNFLQFGSLSQRRQFQLLFDLGISFCEQLVDDVNVKSLIDSQDKSFDLLIIETFFHDCLLAFSHKFGTPVVAACAFGGGASWQHAMMGNPHPLSYVPEAGLAYSGGRMGLLQRAHNVMHHLSLERYRRAVYLPALDQIVRRSFRDPSMPPLAELERNTSLLLLNSYLGLDPPRPLLPNVVPVAGMHIKPPKGLPQELQTFMDSAEDGAIYFSMGSNIKSADLPEELRTVFLTVFSKLKQKVLWKFETEELPNQPPNVKISKWLPQSDILAHNNMKFFITHGGMMSVQEALYNGVPLLGFPIYGDQEPNMVKVQTSGYGIMILPANITEESFSWAVNELLTNPSYTVNAKRYSSIFRDRPERALDTAVYWTEYVLRHRGAYHMRSAALDLRWYQYLLLDVVLSVVLVALGALLALVLVLKTLFRYVFGRSTVTTVKQSKSTKRD